MYEPWILEPVYHLDEDLTMASPAGINQSLTLAEFLRLPEQEPPLEYIDGRIEADVSPQKKHGRIEQKLTETLNGFAEPRRLGLALPEQRCTFAGRSIVPDVVFLLDVHIETDQGGKLVDETPYPPDIHVEVISPEQSPKRLREKLVHSTANGCALGWLIHPDDEWVEVFRPGKPAERLAADGALDGESILPGLRLTLAELFGWLIYRKPASPDVPPAPGNEPE